MWTASFKILAYTPVQMTSAVVRDIVLPICLTP